MNKFNDILKIHQERNNKEFRYEGFSDEENKKLLNILSVKQPLLPWDITDEVLIEIKEIESVLNSNDDLWFKKLLEKYWVQDMAYFIENRLAWYWWSFGLVQAQKINYFLEKQWISIEKEYKKLHKLLMDSIILDIIWDNNNDFLKKINKSLSDEDIAYIMKDIYLIDEEDWSWIYDNIYQKSADRMLLYFKNNIDRNFSERFYINILDSYISQYNYLTRWNKYGVSSAVHLYKMLNFQKIFLPNNKDKIDRIIDEVNKYKNIRWCEDMFEFKQ